MLLSLVMFTNLDFSISDSIGQRPITWVCNEACKDWFQGPNALRLSTLDESNSTIIQDKVQRQVIHIHPTQDRPGFYLKRFRPQRFKHRLGLAKPLHPGKREFRVTEALRKLAIAAPEPVAYGRIVNNGVPVESLYISREVVGSVPLRTMWAEQWDLEQRVPVMQQFGVLLARVHLAGFFVRDLHVDNLLYIESAPVDRSLVLIDHEETRWPAGYWSHWRNRNLDAAFYAHGSPDMHEYEKEEFIRSYLITLRGRNPNQNEMDQCFKAIEDCRNKISARREKRSIRKPFQVLSGPNPYRLVYRRGVDPASYLEHFKSVELSQASQLEKEMVSVGGKNCRIDKAAVSSLTVSSAERDLICRIWNVETGQSAEYRE